MGKASEQPISGLGWLGERKRIEPLFAPGANLAKATQVVTDTMVGILRGDFVKKNTNYPARSVDRWF